MCYKNTLANQPSPWYTVPLTQWPDMPIPCRHLMTHYLSKRCDKCFAMRRLKLRILWWCYSNLSMRELVTVKKISIFFIDRTIFKEPWKPISQPFTVETSILCRENLSTDHSDLKFSDTSSNISPITSLSQLYLFRLSTETEEVEIKKKWSWIVHEFRTQNLRIPFGNLQRF